MSYKKIDECRISTESFETKEKGKTNRVLLNGYWIWWCYKHNQPLAWCEKEKVKFEVIKQLEVFIAKAKKGGE